MNATYRLLKRDRKLRRAQRRLAARGLNCTLFQVCAIIGHAVYGRTPE